MSDESQRDRLAFETAFETRRTEIALFWQRSLFFWGFIVLAAGSFGYGVQHSQGLALLSAGFGFICSLAWTLANRGSKYWQETWEQKVEQFEAKLTGPMFSKLERVQVEKSWLLCARRFSVSRLTIALSDYVAVNWLGLFCRQAFIALKWECLNAAIDRHGPCAFIGFTFAYAVYLAFETRTYVKKVA